MSSAYYSRAGSYSRSYNAEVAESEGRYPLTRAAQVLAKDLGVTQKVAKAALLYCGTCEWHHVGKYANSVEYFDTTDERTIGVARHMAKIGIEQFERLMFERGRRNRWRRDGDPTEASHRWRVMNLNLRRQGR